MRLPIWAWKTTLTRLGFRVTKHPYDRQRFHRHPTLEVLEPKVLMTVSAPTFVSGLLTVISDSGSDTITITSSNVGGTDYVTVNGTVGAVAAASVTGIVVHGGGGDDTIDLSGVLSTKYTSLTSVAAYGEAGNDTITGTSLADTLTGGGGNDTLVGGAGNDTYEFTSYLDGTDTISESSGGGTDTLDFSGYSGPAGIAYLTVDLASGFAEDDHGGAHTLATFSSPTNEIENVVGSQSDDTLIGNSLANVLSGGDGSDYLDGGAGNDTLSGGDGNDTYQFTGSGNLGTDSIVENTGEGADTIDFSGFGDTASAGVSFNLNSSSWSFSNSHVSLSLSIGSAEIENVFGTAYDDTLTGNSLDNGLMGGGGNDTLIGNAGDDYLEGDDGDDTYKFVGTVEQGTDTVDDTSGTDTLDFSSLNLGAGVTVSLSPSAPHYYPEQVVSHSGKQLTIDGLHDSSIENVIGTQYADSITGNALANTLTGGGGNDTLVGGAGNDTYVYTNYLDGTDTISESSGGGTDTLDFSGYAGYHGGAAYLTVDLLRLRTGPRKRGRSLSWRASYSRLVEYVAYLSRSRPPRWVW